ncbi:MAG: PASTA domain-containing protein, partial [Melioribacteraceae bacterium]|nr:PASTA domain-containing protein [Melioribacteraceae bacterium]
YRDNKQTIENVKYASNNVSEEKIFISSNLPTENSDEKIERKIISSGNSSTMPNLINYTKRDAIKILNDLGIKYQIVGSGTVLSQSIKSGSSLKGITDCNLKCGVSKKNSKLRIN